MRARRQRSATQVALALVAVALVAACGGDDLPESTRLCDLGRGNDQGVVGHDLAASAELADGRVLFAFGDTYLGTIRGDARRVDGLLNSSGALLPAGEDICSDRIRYLTGEDGEPRDLLPDPPREDTAYWPVDVAADGDRVWMLYRWVERSGPGPLAIRILGTGLAVADPSDLDFAPVGDLLVEDGTPLPASLHAADDGLAVLVCTGEEDDRGCRLHDLDERTPAIGPARDEPVLDGLAAAEMSLGRVEVDGRVTWRISSMPDLGCRLEVATLDADDWDTDTVLAPDTGGGRLCYAGRLQEPFSEPGRLVATWVESPEERTDADRYWPHVEGITLTEGGS